MSIDLRLGDWRTALSDVDYVDCVITDPPYSDRTHVGRRTGGKGPDGVAYSALTEAHAREFVASWAPRTHAWFVIFGDHVTSQWWRAALGDAGIYVFAPVVWAKSNPAPRRTGDGPTSSCEYITIARKRDPSIFMGSRPGHYITNSRDHTASKSGLAGAKPLGLMERIICDYSRNGWLICDPHSGTGTTARACSVTGRNFIGSEMDHDTYRFATERLRGIGHAIEGAPQSELFASRESD